MTRFPFKDVVKSIKGSGKPSENESHKLSKLIYELIINLILDLLSPMTHQPSQKKLIRGVDYWNHSDLYCTLSKKYYTDKTTGEHLPHPERVFAIRSGNHLRYY